MKTKVSFPVWVLVDQYGRLLRWEGEPVAPSFRTRKEARDTATILDEDEDDDLKFRPRRASVTVKWSPK